MLVLPDLPEHTTTRDVSEPKIRNLVQVCSILCYSMLFYVILCYSMLFLLDTGKGAAFLLQESSHRLPPSPNLRANAVRS